MLRTDPMSVRRHAPFTPGAPTHPGHLSVTSFERQHVMALCDVIDDLLKRPVSAFAESTVGEERAAREAAFPNERRPAGYRRR